MRIQLQLLNGEKIDRSIDMDSFVIGRSAKCDVVIPHEGMSRQHCQIEVINGEVFITDLGSTNGVIIDGERIEAHKKVPYATYLTLAFGAVQSMQITLVEPTRSLNLQNVMPKKDSQKEPISTSSSGNLTAMTKTKTIQEAQKTSSITNNKSSQASAKTESKVNLRSLLINLLCLFIVGAAAWWYMDKDKNAPEAPAEEAFTEQSSGPQ